MDPDTGIGGSQDRFPITRRSAIEGLRSQDPAERSRAFDALVTAYWKPAYKYTRLKWQASNEEAKDLVQGFFVRAFEKGFFADYDPAKASFRTYLRVCLDGFVSNERKAAGRLKRGGAQTLLSLDFDGAEQELRLREPAGGATPEQFFHQEWVRGFFSLAVDQLRAECEARGKAAHFRLFERYDLEEAGAEKTTYEQLAAEEGIPVSSVTNYLAFARRQFRRIVLERLREITGGEQEFRREARFLLGVDPG